MSREELIRKLDSTPILIEGVRLFFRKIVLLVILFAISFTILNVTNYYLYQESPKLDVAGNPENKEQAVFDFFSFNLGGGTPSVPISEPIEFATILMLYIIIYVAIILVVGIFKGIAINKTIKTYEETLETPEEERSTVESIFNRLPGVVIVQGIYIFISGFMPVFLMMLIGYLPNFLKENIGLINQQQDLFTLLTLLFFILFLVLIFATIVLMGRYLFAKYVYAAIKDSTVISSFKMAKRYMQDDTGVIYSIMLLFGFIKFAINAYPMFMLFSTWAYPNTYQESLNAVILIFTVFTPLLIILEGIETATFSVAFVFLHRRYVSYTEMQDRVKKAVDTYDLKKMDTLDTKKMSWRQQKVGEMVLAESEEEEEREFITCEFCGEKFFRQVNYELHLSREHPEESGVDTTEITCEYCGKKIIGQETYQAHLKIFHAAKLKDKEGK